MNLPSLAGVKFLNLPGYIRLEENLNKFRNRLVSSDFLLKGILQMVELMDHHVSETALEAVMY
jgi:hypothetical protein